MGKTPEKVNGGYASGSAAVPVMRYRRKVPTTAALAAAAAVAEVVETTTQEDNQMEHREAEPVVVTDAKRDVLELPRAATQKALNGATVRKKKPKANRAASPPASSDKQEELAVAVAVSETTTSATALSEPVVPAVASKKKLKKRQLPLDNNADGRNDAETADTKPQDADVGESESEPVKPKVAKQNSNRKRKQDAGKASGTGGQKKEHPSLLKQLLWKAKAVAPDVAATALPAAPPTETQAVDANPPSPKASAPQRQQKSKRVSRPLAVEDADEQEEVEYTVSERHNRKLQASKRVSQKAKVQSDSCSAVAVAMGGSELSSQETQPGSDEDESTTSLLSAYENLVPSDVIEPKEISAAVQLNTFYPAHFPLELVADVDQLKLHGITVHEVLIENFTFQPSQLRIKEGDVVVWKVSGETLGMVEHSLEASLMPRQKKPVFVTAATPPLGCGSTFAWRFASPARVHIMCSVYETRGVVLVGNSKWKKEKKEKKKEAQAKVEADEVAEVVATPEEPTKLQRKRKDKYANRKQKAEEARAAQAARVEQRDEALLHGEEDEATRDSIDAEVVFHPPRDLMRSAEIDAGVCRAVLSQLEEVAAAANAANEVIVIGDVECPVLAEEESSLETSNQDEAEDPTDLFAVLVHPDHKPAAMADEWSGTEEDDDDDDHAARAEQQQHEIEDFQQRIIGMLKRSEDARAQHRSSFQQEQSGFDAGAAYDFFKRRFMQVQEERQIVYSVCPEQQTGSGVGVTDVVSLLL